jgi:hypothetical protein
MTIVIDDPETETRVTRAALRAGLTVPEYIRMVLRSTTESTGPLHSLHELRGLGQDLWRAELAGRDATGYINSERDEWDRPR